MKHQSRRTWYIIAPHLSYPLHNGADLYAVGVAKGISYYAETVLVGSNSIDRFQQGNVTEERRFNFGYRAKWKAALLAVLTNKMYQAAKFHTRRFIQLIKSLEIGEYDNIAFSYISATDLHPYFNNKGYKVVFTHNFDIDFFENLRKGLKNPLSKWALGNSIKHTTNFLLENQSSYIFSHNNEADQANYNRLFPKMNHSIFRVGVDVPAFAEVWQKRQSGLDRSDMLRICFTGYLNGQQNLDALLHFEKVFWPALTKKFHGKISFFIIGSSPSLQVMEIAHRKGWKLLADLDDSAFTNAIVSCHYTVLPFPVTSGTKHKLFTSVSRGVPFLATACIGAQTDEVPEGCLLSDDPHEWADCIEAYLPIILEEKVFGDLYTYAAKFSWKAAADEFVGHLDSRYDF